MAALWREGVAAPLILTAELPTHVARWLNVLRQTHYPSGAARAAAHLGLFRHLPGPQAQAIARDVQRMAAEMPAAPVFLEGLMKPDSAVSLRAKSPDLDALRERLADWWQPLLVPGDAAAPRLHITIAAGLSAHEARALAAKLAPEVPPTRFTSRALLLWQHGEPHWTPLVRLAFRR